MAAIMRSIWNVLGWNSSNVVSSSASNTCKKINPHEYFLRGKNTSENYFHNHSRLPFSACHLSAKNKNLEPGPLALSNRRTPSTSLPCSPKHLDYSVIQNAVDGVVSVSYDKIKSLVVSGVTAIQDILPQFPNLKGLQITKVTEGTIEALGRVDVKNVSFANTKLTDKDLILFVKNNPDIENLDISNCGNLTDVGLQALSSLTSLKSLKAGQLSKVTIEGYENIPLGKLEYLDLSSTWPVSQYVGDSICAYLSGAPQLRYLNISYQGGYISGKTQESLTETGLQSLADHNQSLQCLIISNNYTGSREGLNALAMMINLIELEFANQFSLDHAVSDNLMSKLGVLSKLRFLRLSNNVEIVDPACFESFSNSSIEQLWIDSLTKSNVEGGIQHLPETLQDLQMSGNFPDEASTNPFLPTTLCETLAKFEKLRRLVLQNYVLTGSNISNSWEGKFQNLLELEFASGDQAAFEVICRNSFNLESLNLNFSGIPIPEGDQFLMDGLTLMPLTTLKNLRSFTVNGQLPPDFLAAFFSARPPLETLSLSNNTCSPDIIQLVPNLSETLKNLFLMYPNVLEEDQKAGIEVLGKLTQLTTLNLWGNARPEEYGFLEGLNNVTYLMITDDGPVKHERSGLIPTFVDYSAQGVNAYVLACIGRMSNLKTLQFQMIRVDNEAFNGLCLSSSLENLISYVDADVQPPCKIDGGAVAPLSRIPNLQTLYMNGQLTEEEIAQVQVADNLFWAQ